VKKEVDPANGRLLVMKDNVEVVPLTKMLRLRVPKRMRMSVRTWMTLEVRKRERMRMMMRTRFILRLFKNVDIPAATQQLRTRLLLVRVLLFSLVLLLLLVACPCVLA
jgi:hypothetical protein